jgi:hypothetical protein
MVRQTVTLRQEVILHQEIILPKVRIHLKALIRRNQLTRSREHILLQADMVRLSATTNHRAWLPPV